MNYFYYKTTTWDDSNPSVPEQTKEIWKSLAEKKNWRIVQLPNGYYQTEYKDHKDDWIDNLAEPARTVERERAKAIENETWWDDYRGTETKKWKPPTVKPVEKPAEGRPVYPGRSCIPVAFEFTLRSGYWLNCVRISVCLIQQYILHLRLF